MPDTAQRERTHLRSYLPRLLLQWIAQSPAANYQEVEGSVAFVDISGFTKLSERLAKRGKVGAEELTDAIGTCFTRLLAVAYGNGGSLLKFGGDALLLLFRGDEHQAKAARAAVGMRRALKEIGGLDTGSTRVTLRMSVGIHSGVFHFFLVGDSHRELIIAGPAATETVVMESTAEAGEIVVSPATAAALSEGVIGAAKGPGFLLRRQPPGLSREPAESDPGDDDARLLSYIPVAVRDRVIAGLDEPEHKRVTVAFVHFDGTDELIERSGPRAAAEYLDTLVQDVQDAVDRHGICFLGTDVDRDGGKVILAAGAPAAMGNDEERMLLAIREIVEVDRVLPIRIGVNRGHVFAGEIGPSYRRTYTVMGDAVNLAARLMAKATAGQVLATEGVLGHSRTQFDTMALEPFMVKGKAQPVQAYSVEGVAKVKRAETEARVPLVGREAEMEALLAALESARLGDGRLVEIIGEPGIGKSRLIEELRDQAGEIAFLSAPCELYESSTPYAPFRRLLRAILSISDDVNNEVAGDRLRQVLDELAPELHPWAPLLAVALDIEVPSTTEVDQLKDEFRRPRLGEVMRDLLARLLRTTTLLTIDDVHWMDEASADLLRRLTGDLGGLPWLVCVTRRDVDTGFTAAPAEHVIALRPEPLGAEAATALVDAVTEESPLAPHEIAALAERSGGNPLFLKELLAAARAAGGLEGLPDTVDAVITARIDRLAPSDRSFLRHVSVLGLNFPRALGEAVLPDEFPSSNDPAWERLGEFISLRNGTVRFSHALIRDAAYDGLAYRLRQNLHALVGETIEKDAGGDADDEAELLSLHFFNARRYDRAWRYSQVAAERARAIYANVEAAEFYERAVEAARREGTISSLDLARVYESLGEARRDFGDYAKAGNAYRLASRLVREDPVASARLLLKQAWIRQVTGRAVESLRWLRRAERVLQGGEGREAAIERANLAAAYAQVRREQGRAKDAITWCFRAIEEAEAVDDKETVARACVLLDNVYAGLGDWEHAKYSRRALAILEELGDLWGQGTVLNNLGVYAQLQGQWEEAVDLFDRGRVVREKVGDAVHAALGTLNVAEVRADQGRLEEAEPLFRKALRVFQAADHRGAFAYTLRNLGRLVSRRRDFVEAMELLQRSRRLFDELGAKVEVLETDARIAECLVLQGKSDEAMALIDKALARAQALGDPGLPAVLMQRAKGQALAQSGKIPEAREALEDALRSGRALNADYEVALTLRALALVESKRDAGDPLEAESRAILQRLGVISLNDPPVMLAAAKP